MIIIRGSSSEDGEESGGGDFNEGGESGEEGEDSGGIKSLRNPESFEMLIEDRIEKIELINGNAVQDYGHIETGDKFALTCIFTVEDYRKLAKFWEKRTKVTFVDEAGTEWADMRLVIQRVKYLRHFPDYVELTFELWRI